MRILSFDKNLSCTVLNLGLDQFISSRSVLFMTNFGFMGKVRYNILNSFFQDCDLCIICLISNKHFTVELRYHSRNSISIYTMKVPYYSIVLWWIKNFQVKFSQSYSMMAVWMRIILDP